MPKQKPSTSTNRRCRLCDFINSFREVIVQKCSTYAQNKRVCKVYIYLGKCSECMRYSQQCNVCVTELEFKRLAAEKEKLRVQIKESRNAQDAAIKAHKKALEELRVQRAREEQLQLQIDLLDCRAKDAIAVKSREIKELKREEASQTIEFARPSKSLALNLSPSTQSAFEGLPLNY